MDKETRDWLIGHAVAGLVTYAAVRYGKVKSPLGICAVHAGAHLAASAAVRHWG